MGTHKNPQKNWALLTDSYVSTEHVSVLSIDCTVE